ncbi:hypothetical protein GCM10010399_88810 [Dactylosporangium fulvum]|uniref:Secreted protein n=1 Tax=Dactylosporangium fulvum TaxID=53359 RepID=A0ABY5VS71_9ACTN|nr:hypothetical protein [Dactylosporangium fulvum]UWP80627.1 hypothetical protein Dfulv_36525 [Dactylosporangium fulvum]
MKLNKSHLGAGALALGAVLAFAVPAGAAVNLQSESGGTPTIKIAKTARLKANGAATVATVNVTCPVGNWYSTYVEVVQTVNPTSTTRGNGSIINQRCSGFTEKVKVPVTASGAPFQVGVAYAVGQLEVTGPIGYINVNTGREIVNVNS